jgi:DNA-binding NarL/FixJ family response regulator
LDGDLVQAFSTVFLPARKFLQVDPGAICRLRVDIMPVTAVKALSKRRVNGKKKVLIVDDHPVFREGLAQVISSEHTLTVCGRAGTAAEGIQGTSRLKPDIVLLDITLPDRSGLEIIKLIRQAHPGVKILVISMHDEALYANRVLRLGGDGYIMKQEDPTEVVTAIQDILDGHIYVSDGLMSGGKEKPAKAEPVRPLDALSDSQLEILELLGQGVTYAEIGERLRLNTLAVASQCEAIRNQLGLKSDNALIRYAVCWVELGTK